MCSTHLHGSQEAAWGVGGAPRPPTARLTTPFPLCPQLAAAAPQAPLGDPNGFGTREEKRFPG